MKYPEFVSICVNILKEQYEWLSKRENSKSEVIRFALQKLIEKEHENGERNQD